MAAGGCTVPMTLRGSGRVLHDVLRAAAEEDRDAPLVTFLEDRTYTRGELYDRALHVAGAIRHAGVEPGERVAIIIGNRIEFLACWLGASAAGVVAVPLNTAMRGAVLTHMLDLTEPRLLIGDAEYAPQVEEALGEATYLGTRVWLGSGAQTSGLTYEQFLEAAPLAEPYAAEPWDLAGIYFTSGTTGPSKGVMWAQNMAVAMAESAIAVMGYTSDDALFTCLPLFHANALCCSFLAALMTGARVIVAERFSASQFWQQVSESGATTVNLLGSMAPILWRQEPTPWEKAHRLRLALVIPPPIDHFDEFEARFQVTCTELYGLTDANIPIGMPHGSRHPGSCGVPLPGYECRLVDEIDEPVPVGQPGELVVRPLLPFITQLGYWRMPDATVQAWRNQWFHTGDLMRQDEEGWYYFLDRSKDAIRRFGENISSFEVEQVLLSHPAVFEAAVYAVPAELSEDEVMAAVVLLPDAEATPEEIVNWCEPRLAYFAVPRYVDIRESLPKTQTEKVQKQVLRGEGVTSTAFDRGPSGRRMRERARLQESGSGTP
jgi:crotonobetaine/carnitine-CoA ligase